MNTKPRSIKVQDSLLAALQRKTPSSSPEAVDQALLAVEPMPRRDAKPLKPKFGAPAQFWLHDEDRRILRELAAWLSGQGLRLTDSMVIRAALRTAKTGDELLQACRRAAEADGRLKRHKAARS
jgi:hypothetical protein